MERLYDAHRSECLYRLRSPARFFSFLVAQDLLQGPPATALIGHLEYLGPGQIAHFGLEPVSSDTPVSQAEGRLLRFGDNPMQPALNQGPQGDALLGRHFARFA